VALLKAGSAIPANAR
jgi:Ca2+-transporting ATPase